MKTWRVMAVSTAILSVGLTLTACGSGKDGSSGGSSSSSTISLGSIGPETGQDSAIFVANKAMAAYFDNINAHGGVNGKKVTVHLADDQFNAANTEGAAQGLVTQDHVSLMCALAGTPDNAAVRPYLTKNKVFNIAPGTAQLTETGGATNQYMYYMLPTYERSTAALVQYAVKVLHKKRIGIVYSPNESGLPALAGVKWELSQLHMKLAASATYQIPPTSLATQAAAMKAANADFVINWDTPATFGLLENASAQIGYHPDFGGGWFASGASLEQLTKGAFNGHQYFITWLPISSDPASATIAKVVNKYAPGSSVSNGQTLQGWVAGDICYHVLQKATAGGKALTVANLQAALSHFTLSDQYVQGIDWSGSDHGGTSEGRIIEMTSAGGDIKAMTGVQALPNAPFSG